MLTSNVKADIYVNIPMGSSRSGTCKKFSTSKTLLDIQKCVDAHKWLDAFVYIYGDKGATSSFYNNEMLSQWSSACGAFWECAH